MAEEAVGAGIQRVLAPHDQVFGALPTRMVVAVLEVLRPVDFGHARTQQVVDDRGARTVAGFAAERIGGSTVAGVEHRRPVHRRVQRALATGPGQREDGLGAVFRPDLAHLRLDEVVRFIPRHFGPLVLAAVGAVADQRMLQALVVVHHLVERDAPGAEAPLRHGMVGVAFHLDHLAVFNVNDESASHGMVPRGRPCTRAHLHHAILLDGKLLAEPHFQLLPFVVCRKIPFANPPTTLFLSRRRNADGALLQLIAAVRPCR